MVEVVEQGGIVIEGVTVKRADENCVLCWCDLEAKYASVEAVMVMGSVVVVSVKQGERTLFARSPEPTSITVQLPVGQWSAQARTGRYTLEIIAVRHPAKPVEPQP
jgi:hypothetical protein